MKINQSGIPDWLKRLWIVYIKSELEKHPEKAHVVSIKAGLNPSYMCRMKQGYIPSREVVEKVGQVFGSPQKALLMAGYIPNMEILKELASRKNTNEKEMN